MRTTPARAIAAAAAVTTLDGFDAFSFSLVAPKVITELGLARAALGTVFAGSMAGMIAGALGGGVLADRVGHGRVFLFALLLFAAGALGMLIVHDATGIIVDRVVAGAGLGAAAPVAVALLNRASSTPPSDLIVTVVWTGLPVGGVLAALFNYLVIPAEGWRSIFVAGGLAPLPVAAIAWWVFGRARVSAPTPAARKGRIADLFGASVGGATAIAAGMFFFGYVTTSIIVNWMPTILAHRHASELTVSVTFAAINIGGAAGTLGLGLLSRAEGLTRLLIASWAAAGVTAVLAAWAGAHLLASCALAVASATLAAGSQALSVALANRLNRARGLEATTVGFCIGVGRLGQVAALGLTGALIGAGVPEAGLLAFAGASACLAAAMALFAGRSNLETTTR